MDPTLIFPVLTGAISVLFWALIREKDARIAELEKDKTEMRTRYEGELDERDAKIETLNDQLGKNSDALDQVAATQEQVAGLLASLLTSPPSSGGPRRSGTA